MASAGGAIKAVSLERYDLPFSKPWHSAQGVLTRRRGWIVGLTDDAGIRGTGECAPLEEAGTESFGHAEHALELALGRLEGRTPAIALHDFEITTDTPAARCAVESALLDLESRQAGVPMRQWLSDEAPGEVRINAALGIADPALIERAERAAARGFRVLKVKIGVGRWEDELAVLRQTASALPTGVRLRLDANGAWQGEQVRSRIADLAGVAGPVIEALEEPLDRVEPDLLADLQALVPFSLALDESFAGQQQLLLSGVFPVSRVVLKPMVLGGAAPVMRLADAARDSGVEVVVTTTLEAAPGRWFAAQLAAASGSRLAHGLDTGDWLAEDLGPGPEIERGLLSLEGTGAGLGVILRSESG